ncbi:TrwE protein [Bartonella australis AUST/NH1]|uniref:TrwE protein n=1 Tax=Bartonella australis (strain Aust/NH1) TaxID=1094489 RepID=M1N5C2_BARAA|nr:type IV secretion system protein VirB10 [Bartonella australis]AGF75079.1 TrwE protein [Bartonella australis AUST/NH1]
MFGREKGDEINTGEKPDHTDTRYIEGDYGSSELNSEHRPTMPGSRALLVVVLVAIIAIPVALSWKALSMRNAIEASEEDEQLTVQQVIPSYTPRVIKEEPPIPEKAPPREEAPPSDWSQLIQTALPSQLVDDVEELARKRMLNSGLVSSSGGTDAAHTPKAATPTDDDKGPTSKLSEQLQPVRLSESRASRLRNRDLIITQGTQLDCVLATKITTAQPGMTTCHLTRDIYSTSGRVVLLDRGSKIIGFYQSGVQQGQNRVFVQWSRVETPSGVIIDLDSPGTGPLGEAGIGGWVDRHFWERFSNAIMISLITDFGGWLRDTHLKKDNKSPPALDTRDAQSVTTEILQSSMNIAPTLYKNQGERVSIFVARDLDFSDVYALKAN